MGTGGASSAWADSAALLAAVEAAEPTRLVVEYYSETLKITRVVTAGSAGTFFLVTVSDLAFFQDEDATALMYLSAELAALWSTRVLDTDVWSVPHYALPLSSTHQVHVVHPACVGGRERVSFDGPIGAGRQHDALSEPS